MGQVLPVKLTWNDLEVARPPDQPRSAVGMGEPRRVNNLTLIDGKTFLATTLAGDIAPPSSTDVGLFHQDTRFLSQWELRVNAHRAVVLSAANQQNILAQIELTTTNILVRDNLDLPENTVHIHREQLLAGDFFDHLTFRNFNLEPVTLTVEFCFDCDFMDVFQVRGMVRSACGTYFEPVARTDRVVFAYLGRDELFRQCTLVFSPEPQVLEARLARYELRLGPGEQQRLEIAVATAVGPPPERGALVTVGPAEEERRFSGCLERRRQSYADWARATTSFESSDTVFDECLNTAMSDFFSLRVPFGQNAEGGKPVLYGVTCGVLPF